MFVLDYFSWFDAAILTALVVVVLMGFAGHGSVS
jgi:hypothetical protein